MKPSLAWLTLSSSSKYQRNLDAYLGMAISKYKEDMSYPDQENLDAWPNNRNPLTAVNVYRRQRDRPHFLI